MGYDKRILLFKVVAFTGQYTKCSPVELSKRYKKFIRQQVTVARKGHNNIFFA